VHNRTLNSVVAQETGVMSQLVLTLSDEIQDLRFKFFR
jgi:hypothetical protein